MCGHAVYDDNLCLFRCLALQNKANVGGLEETTSTRKYKEKLEIATGNCYVDGVKLDMVWYGMVWGTPTLIR